jgi:hypothetical protein
MRSYVIASVVFVGLAGPCQAYENFIPLGTGYSAEVESLPRFDSSAGDTASKADIYETELYFSGRKAIEADSRFRRFQSDAEFDGSDNSIDY